MTYNSIGDISASRAGQVYFVGAGISANPPTRFPLARVLVSQILEAIASDQQTLDLLETLADPNREDKRNPGDYIRFELLLDIIQQLVDPGLSLLEFVELFADPNPLHQFLANRAISGDIVVTTNFDCLIEAAIIKLGSQPITICTTEDFESWTTGRPNRVPVYKIHGSYRRHDGSLVGPALNTIQATLSTLTTAAKDLVLPEAKREFLIEVTRGRSLIICGYSGGDDLDIVPTFKLLSPRSLDWLVHNEMRQEAYDATKEWRDALEKNSEASLSTRDRFMRNQLLEGAYPLRIYEVDTPVHLLQGGDINPIFDYSPDPDRSDPRLLAFVEDWASTFLSEPHLKHLVSGHILFSLTRFQESYESYLDAWTLLDEDLQRSESAEVARMISRIAVEIGRFNEGKEWAEKSVNLTPIDTSAKAKSLHQQGFALYKLGNLPDAFLSYREAEAICRKHDVDRILSYVLHDTALVYQELSQFRKAIPLYEQSIKLSANDGDIRHVMFSYHQLGTSYFDLGEFSHSRTFHLRALELARVIGDYAQIDNSEHELGMMDFMAGRILNSIRHFHCGIEIAKLTGRLQFIPMDLQHVGIALMEIGKLRSAGRFLTAAQEGYQTINDEITLSELQSYLCEYHLLLGDYATASAAAQTGHEIASRFGAHEYETRAAFMIGLTLWMNDNHVKGRQRMCDALHMANAQEFKALLLDQLSLCARFNVYDMVCEELPALVQWALNTYLGLGNNRRRQILEHFSKNL